MNTFLIVISLWNMILLLILLVNTKKILAVVGTQSLIAMRGKDYADKVRKGFEAYQAGAPHEEIQSILND